MLYSSYLNYMVRFCEKTKVITIIHAESGAEIELKLCGMCQGDELVFPIEWFNEFSYERDGSQDDKTVLKLHFSNRAEKMKLDVLWNEEKKTLKITSELIEQDPYILTVYVSESYQVSGVNIGKWEHKEQILTVEIMPEESGENTIEITFA